MTFDRTDQLHDLLARRILILDGAMGTMIQSYRLQEADYRGERFHGWPRDLKGNNDLLVLTQPAIIQEIHAAYLDAGADIVETNTFNSTSVSMHDHGMASLVPELTRNFRLMEPVLKFITVKIADDVEPEARKAQPHAPVIPTSRRMFNDDDAN